MNVRSRRAQRAARTWSRIGSGWMRSSTARRSRDDLGRVASSRVMPRPAGRRAAPDRPWWSSRRACSARRWPRSAGPGCCRRARPWRAAGCGCSGRRRCPARPWRRRSCRARRACALSSSTPLKARSLVALRRLVELVRVVVQLLAAVDGSTRRSACTFEPAPVRCASMRLLPIEAPRPTALHSTVRVALGEHAVRGEVLHRHGVVLRR